MKDLTPIMTSNDEIINNIHYRITADSCYLNGSSIYKIMDNKWKDYTFDWLSGDTNPPHWIIIDMGRPITLNRIDVMPGSDNVDLVFKDFEIYCSNDNIIYDKVYTGTYPDNKIANRHFIECMISELKCRYIKINILSGYNKRSYKWFGVSEVKIYGQDSIYYMNSNNENFIYDNTIKLTLNTIEDIKNRALTLSVVSKQYIEKEIDNNIRIKKLVI